MALATHHQLLTQYASDNIAALIAEQQFIADRLIGRLEPVSKSTFQYRKFGFQHARRPKNVLVNSGDPTPQISEWATLESGITEEIRLQMPVTHDDAEQHPEGRAGAERDALNLVMLQNLIDWEARVVTIANTISATDTAFAAWSDPSADPIDDIRDAIEGVRLLCGLVPNTIVMSQGDYSNFITSGAVRNFVKGSSNAGQMPTNEVEAALGTISSRPMKILVGSAAYNTALADTSSTITGADLWTAGTCYVMYQGPMINAPKTIGGFAVAAEDNKVFTASDAMDLARGSTFVQHKFKRVSKLVSDGCGYRITGC